VGFGAVEFSYNQTAPCSQESTEIPMNALENWFCSTSLWRYLTQKRLLPWILSGSEIGEHVLELGSGPGAGTRELRSRAARVTSLEYNHTYAAGLARRQPPANGSVLQGDAAALPFADGSFSSVVAVLMLHHFRSSDLQHRAFAEVHRVLRPGGVFLAFEIQDGWLQRAIHRNSTFVPVCPASVPALLTAAGFARVTVDIRFGGFRIRARRARES
jgi:SAM-dependent methyltransferase